MIASVLNTKTRSISLAIKTLGVSNTLEFTSVSDAADHAVSLISTGKAIPKSLSNAGGVVMTEDDINLYWEQSQ